MITLDKCNGICNTVSELFGKTCDPSKTEDVILSLFNLITGTIDSKTLVKHISCNCKCKFHSKKCNSNQK